MARTVDLMLFDASAYRRRRADAIGRAGTVGPASRGLECDVLVVDIFGVYRVQR
jgi:hypothetical protein